jgi:hypothetical protein
MAHVSVFNTPMTIHLPLRDALHYIDYKDDQLPHHPSEFLNHKYQRPSVATHTNVFSNTYIYLP